MGDDKRQAPRESAGSPLCGGNIYFARVVGNSMTGDGINDGDLIAIDPDTTPHDGDIAAVIIKNYTFPGGRVGDHRMVKRLSDGGTVLTSSNPAQPPIVLQPEHTLIVEGRVVAAGHLQGLVRVTVTREDVAGLTIDDPMATVTLTGTTAEGQRVTFITIGLAAAKARAHGTVRVELSPSDILTGQAG
jgi:hypothetical protein